jgi:hypothetical protein
MKKKNKVKIEQDHLKLSKQISRKLFKNIPMTEKTVKDKTKYNRKNKHKQNPDL